VEEMKKCMVIAFLIGILIGFAIGYGYFPVKGQQIHAKESAYSYLVNSYNSTIGLCYENPENKNVYWVTNDNVLASYALQQWNREIADNITETIKRIARDYDLTTSPIGIPIDTRAEILLGYNVKNFNKTENITLNASYYGSILKTENATNEILSAQVLENYTDLLCYASLVEWRKGNYSGADYYYGTAKTMWDGNGFRDAPFNKTGYYATYKLGLFYFVNRMLNKGSFWFEKQLIERVWQCQDSNGGFKTDYYANGSFPDCQTNTETTSIILISDVPYPLFAYKEELKLGAYYYIWWGIPFNNHWNEAVKGTPFLGKYNSSDPTVADQHILLAKQHGIDFFAVSWMGNGTWADWDFDEIDYNLRNGLLKAPHLQNFKFCLFYETQIVLDTANQKHKNFTEIFLNDMVYAAEKYFINPSYLRINDKPVLFIYNLPYLYENLTDSAVHGLFDQMRQQLANISDVYLVDDVGPGPSPNNVNSTWLYSINATTSYFFSDPSKGWNGVLEDARTYYPNWASVMNSKGINFIPNAYSGFNNTGLARVVEPVALSGNANAFREFLTIAINNVDDLKMVMITSWNEWLEATAIEPSMEFGELFLHTIYDVVPEFPSSTILSLFMILAMIVAIYSKKRFGKIKNKRYK
jgi:hypothetical protein